MLRDVLYLLTLAGIAAGAAVAAPDVSQRPEPAWLTEICAVHDVC